MYLDTDCNIVSLLSSLELEAIGNRSVRLVTVSVWFHESGFSFSNLAVHFSSLFWFL